MKLTPNQLFKSNGMVLTLHHTSKSRGYVSRRPNPDGSFGYAQKYSGKFGEGYAVYTPSYDSTRYCYVSYYVY